jgi:hypothetical protein
MVCFCSILHIANSSNKQQWRTTLDRVRPHTLRWTVTERPDRVCPAEMMGRRSWPAVIGVMESCFGMISFKLGRPDLPLLRVTIHSPSYAATVRVTVSPSLSASLPRQFESVCSPKCACLSRLKLLVFPRFAFPSLLSSHDHNCFWVRFHFFFCEFRVCPYLFGGLAARNSHSRKTIDLLGQTNLVAVESVRFRSARPLFTDLLLACSRFRWITVPLQLDSTRSMSPTTTVA